MGATAARPKADGDAALPFAGLRVLDMSWVGVGPITMKYLADHGAEVIRVESVSRPDPARSVPPYKDGKPGFNRSQFPANFNTGKYGLGLNMTTAGGARAHQADHHDVAARRARRKLHA